MSLQAVGQPGWGRVTEDPPRQLHSRPQLIWDPQQLLLAWAIKLSCCFIFIVVSINEVSHQFCFTINHGQESGCCREGHSAQLCLAGAELASPFPACPSPGTSGTLIRDTLSCLVLLFSLSTLQGGPEVAKPQNAFLC